jgi:transcriptional regulator with XRE-family HTH domain
MRTFGEVIAQARKKAHLTQRQLAAQIRNEEGKGISGPYLNDIEHNFRHPTRGYLLEQFARALDVDIDLLYFLAKQLPVEIDMNNVSEEQGVAAYRAFRGASKEEAKGGDCGSRMVSQAATRRSSSPERIYLRCRPWNWCVRPALVPSPIEQIAAGLDLAATLNQLQCPQPAQGVVETTAVGFIAGLTATSSFVSPYGYACVSVSKISRSAFPNRPRQ